jgi:hypothetical protein
MFWMSCCVLYVIEAMLCTLEAEGYATRSNGGGLHTVRAGIVEWHAICPGGGGGYASILLAEVVLRCEYADMGSRGSL